jgi:hypothetical protein
MPKKSSMFVHRESRGKIRLEKTSRDRQLPQIKPLQEVLAFKYLNREKEEDVF